MKILDLQLAQARSRRSIRPERSPGPRIAGLIFILMLVVIGLLLLQMFVSRLPRADHSAEPGQGTPVRDSQILER